MKLEISEKKLHTLAKNLSVASLRSVKEVLEILPESQAAKLKELILFYKKRRESKVSATKRKK
jgi:hypothetical protein